MTDVRVDFAVAGGGLAGVCAALAAARCGARVALLTDRPVLGGNSSSEIGVGPDSAAKYNAFMMETGIVEELLLADRAGNHESLCDAGRANSRYDLCLYDAVTREPNVALFLSARVCGADVEDGRILRVRAVRAGQPPLCVEARQFADCTGDGELGFLAGAAFRYGREARAQFGENLAPAQADEVTMGATVALMARDIGRNAPFTAPVWAVRYERAEEIGLLRSVAVPPGEPRFDGFWWMEMGAPYHQIDDFDALRHELLRRVLGVWDFVKNRAPDRDNARTLALEWVSALPGKRESRRLVGEATLTERDIREGGDFADAVCAGGWFLDEHIPGGILSPAQPPELANLDAHYKHYAQVVPYGIPLRALHSINVQNLWMAGRCMSVSHVALCSVRIQGTLAQTGQAVGTAAAYALQRGLSPRETVQAEHVNAIRRRLQRDDVRIPGKKTDYGLDGVTAQASSEALLRLHGPAGEAPLDIPRGQVFPVTHGRVDCVRAYLMNRSGRDTLVQAELHELARIWDEDVPFVAGRAEALLPAGFSGYVSFALNAPVAAGRAHRFCLYPAEGVFWAKAENMPVGALSQYRYDCPGGCQPQHGHLSALSEQEKHIPAFSRWCQPARAACCQLIDVAPCPAPYGAACSLDGSHHPDDMPHLWAADPSAEGAQQLTLRFPAPRRLLGVRVVLDTDLHLAHGRMPGFWRAPSCAEAFDVCDPGTGDKLGQVRGNCQRVVDVLFPAAALSGLQLRFPCARTARVYQVIPLWEGAEPWS